MLRHALRALRTDLLFSLTALTVLAVGIGANTAVFTVVNSILLRPLQYRDPERLFAIDEIVPQFASSAPLLPVNSRHFLEWKRLMKSFEDVALADNREFNLTGSGEPERITGARVTANFFSVLGVTPELGRQFLEEEAQDGRDNVVLITDALWRRHFGSDPNLVGHDILLNGVPNTVAGILPPWFRQHLNKAAGMGPARGRPEVFKVWALKPQGDWAGSHNYASVARLKQGVTREQALAELNVIQAGITTHFEPEMGKLDLLASLTPLKDRVVDRSRVALLLLLGAVGAVLLIGCVNLGNLMLVRASRRDRETAIRLALGAEPRQVAAGILLESLLVALMGGLLGIGVAAGLLKMFAVWAPVDLPRADEVAMDLPMLLFAIALAVVTAALFGLVPAWRLTKADPQEALRSGGRGQSESASKTRLRELLVSVEAGLSVALLIVAGLLSASFLRLGAVDPGFVSSNVLTAEVSLPVARYKDDDACQRFYRDLVSRLSTQPGVIAAGAVSVLPFGGTAWSDLVSVEGDTRPAAAKPIVEYRPVSPDYFRAMGIPLEKGRSVQESDYPHKPAVLSKLAAEKFWPGQDPIGKRFRRFDPSLPPYEVVGIVGDIRGKGLEKDPVPLIYVPLWELTPTTISLAVRTAGDPVAAVGTMRDVVHAADAQVPLSLVRTMVQIEKNSLAQRSFEMLVAGAFACSALLLALIGTYSVLAYSVSARTNEIGIRMALGAAQARVIGMILADGLRPVIIGVGAGAAIALVLGRFLKTLLYSISPADPVVFTMVIVATLGAGCLACLIPARRAAGVSPMEALRHE